MIDVTQVYRASRSLRDVAIALILSAGPVFAEAAKPTLRIWEWDGDFYQTITDGCLSALDMSAQDAGLTTKVFRSRSDEINENPKDTLTIGVVPTTASANLFSSAPKATEIFDDVAPFTGPAHFARFLNSALYRSLFSDVPVVFPFSHNATVGMAYGSTAQIYTADKPIRTPDEMRGRTQIGTFGDWWYVSLHDQLGIGHDPVLGHAATTLSAQREALTKAARGRGPGEYFIVAPVLMADKIVPAELRTYVSLTMTHISLVSFVAAAWDSVSDDQKALVNKIVTEASKFCSTQNFDRERSAISEMKRSGSTIVPVDVGAFQLLSVTALDHGVDEARANLEKAKSKKADEGTSSEESMLDFRQQELNLYSRLQQLR